MTTTPEMREFQCFLLRGFILLTLGISFIVLISYNSSDTSTRNLFPGVNISAAEAEEDDATEQPMVNSFVSNRLEIDEPQNVQQNRLGALQAIADLNDVVLQNSSPPRVEKAERHQTVLLPAQVKQIREQMGKSEEGKKAEVEKQRAHKFSERLHEEANIRRQLLLSARMLAALDMGSRVEDVVVKRRIYENYVQQINGKTISLKRETVENRREKHETSQEEKMVRHLINRQEMDLRELLRRSVARRARMQTARTAGGVGEKRVTGPTLPAKVLPTLPAKVLPTLPAKVLPTFLAKILPTKVLPTLPAKVLPTLPAKVLPALPAKILPTKVLPTLPAKVLPTKVLPTLPAKFLPTLPAKFLPTLPAKVLPALPTKVLPTLPAKILPTLPTKIPTLATKATTTATGKQDQKYSQGTTGGNRTGLNAQATGKPPLGLFGGAGPIRHLRSKQRALDNNQKGRTNRRNRTGQHFLSLLNGTVYHNVTGQNKNGGNAKDLGNGTHAYEGFKEVQGVASKNLCGHSGSSNSEAYRFNITAGKNATEGAPTAAMSPTLCAFRMFLRHGRPNE